LKPSKDGYRITTTVLKNSIILHLDGKKYPTPADEGIAQSVGSDNKTGKRVNNGTIETTLKRDGKAVASIRREVSADGRLLTVTSDGVGTDGKKFHQIIVYDRQ
jgi:hypothetical protein